jgi:hypothetical protein
MKNTPFLLMLAATAITISGCKKESTFLNREDGMAKTSATDPSTPYHPTREGVGDARFMTLHSGQLSQSRFRFNDGVVRGMTVRYNVAISSDNLIRVGTSIRWVAGNAVPNMPPEIDFALIMDEPSVGRGYVRAHAVVPPSGADFGPMSYVILSFDDFATTVNGTYLPPEQAVILLRYGTVSGFRL